MPEIRPFRAWRYNASLSAEIENLTSPLFDVVSDRQRVNLYQNPFNSIHLSVPQPPFAADRAALAADQWKSDGILVQDRLPAIYVYYQYFTLPGTPREFCRKGFVCMTRLHGWDENIVRRHESTIPKSVNDRLELLTKTELNVAPTHGLYTDGDFILEKYMDEAILNPLLETEDYQGVRDVMAVIHDGVAIRRFAEVLRNRNIILADGHHRYEGSLSHQREQKRANPFHTGDEGYNFHLMYLTNTEGGDLRILPTHRIVHRPGADEDAVMEKIGRYFTVRPVEPASIPEIISGKQWAFGLVFRENAYKVRLKPEVYPQLNWPFPDEVRSLDLTVLHFFILQQVLGIPGREQRKSDNVTYERSFPECLRAVREGAAGLAIITNEVSIEQVKRVCETGYTMPQKSTYFYPKVVCGFLFGSVREEEFKRLPFAPF